MCDTYVSLKFAVQENDYVNGLCIYITKAKIQCYPLLESGVTLSQ